MSVFSSLIDQSEVINVLQEAVKSSKNKGDQTQAMTHAWLFTGPPGSGRSNAAIAFAAALVCKDGGCSKCVDCMSTITGAHADVELIKTEGLSIKIDEIRELMGKEALDNTIKTQAQIISDNINALSPLVANKVLESMTADEIRSLVGLKAQIQQVAPLETLSSVDLSEFGEEIDLDKYELIDSRAVDYEQEDKLDSQLSVHLSTGSAYGNAKSEEDSPIYKVRYRYDGNPSPERSFCKEMMSANKIYRREDIDRMIEGYTPYGDTENWKEIFANERKSGR